MNVEFKNFIQKLGFHDSMGEGSYDLEERSCSYDDMSDQMGEDECGENFHKHFSPIAKEVNAKAKELKIKIRFTPEQYYGILSVEQIA